MVHPTTKMADEEVVSTQYAEERWSLLNSLKCTVENIIMSNFGSSQVTTGSFPQVKIDLERIFKHGQRRQQVRIFSFIFIVSLYVSDEHSFQMYVKSI